MYSMPRNHIEAKYTQLAETSARYEPLTGMKLQKLVYYGQAWSLVWDDKCLFPEQIEAWIYGPVVRELFNVSRGHFRPQRIPSSLTSTGSLNEKQVETVDLVVTAYGKFKTGALVNMTHAEKPWQEARKGLGPIDHGDTIISTDLMKEFYTNLDQGKPC